MFGAFVGEIQNSPVLNDGSCVGRFADGAELLVQEFVVARDGNHGSVVGCVSELRNVDVPFSCGLLRFESVSQPRVGRYASREGDVVDARLLDRLFEFLHEDVNDGLFERRSEVGLIFFDEVGIVFDFLLEKIEERRFQTAETIVKPVDVRFAELKALGVSMIFEHLSMASPAASSMVCPRISILL